MRIYDSQTARHGILKRSFLEDMAVSPVVAERIRRTFGAALSPAQAVERILADIRTHGDAAALEWTEKLDGASLDTLRVAREALTRAWEDISPADQEALSLARERVLAFHKAQPVTSWFTNQLGGTLGQFMRPIKRVGLYVPGGTAPLPSSVLMSALPAQAAGVEEIVLVSPPSRGDGRINQSILAAAALCGIEEVYAIGGAQAIGVLAYGTQTIRPVDKIFGPGNLFVTLAKKQVYGMVGIDGLAGPTETVVVADEQARPSWVAADLLAQAEHDQLAAAILLTPSAKLAVEVQEVVARQLEERSRQEILEVSLSNRSGIVVTRDLGEALELANSYAPEHLCLSVRDPWEAANQIHAAGGIFMGEHSFEVLGDYIAGPSHVMPTGGTARFASPLNVLDFVHVISLVALDAATTGRIAPLAARIADLEGLDAHAASARVRLESA